MVFITQISYFCSGTNYNNIKKNTNLNKNLFGIKGDK